MTNLDRLSIMTDTAEIIGLFDDCKAIAIINIRGIPEAWKFLGDYIVYDYRVSVYDMQLVGKRSYLADIHGIGRFQIF